MEIVKKDTLKDTYSTIGWLAMIAVPVAPAFFFGWNVFAEVRAETEGLLWLAIPVGVFSAFGLEVTGILAGHLLMEFWKRRSYDRAALSGVILLIYTAIGVVHLWGSVGSTMFIIAPLVYLLVALRHTLTNETAVEENQGGYQRQAAAEDREHQRRLDVEKMRLQHEERLARINGKNGAMAEGKARHDVRHDAANVPGDWRQLSRAQRRDLAHATREERDAMFPELASRTRREWHKRLDEIAAQNGQY